MRGAVFKKIHERVRLIDDRVPRDYSEINIHSVFKGSVIFSNGFQAFFVESLCKCNMFCSG